MGYRKSYFWGKKLLLGFCGLLAILLGLRIVWLKPYEIPSSSMEPTLITGDYILVNKLAYRHQTPFHGDIVVFRYPEDPERTFIKRVIALQGESFEIKNSSVYINGKPIVEPYIKERKVSPCTLRTVPQGHLLVLGDNRNNSRDSRDWGMLPVSDLLGKAILVYSPTERIGILH